MDIPHLHKKVNQVIHNQVTVVIEKRIYINNIYDPGRALDPPLPSVKSTLCAGNISF